MIKYIVNNTKINIDAYWLSGINNEQIKCVRGVYAWYIFEGGKKIYLYIGNTKENVCSSITSRFLGELSGPQISTDKGKSFDTDSTVSACIGFLVAKDYDIYFEKLSDNIEDEVSIAREKKPILQKVTENRVCLDNNIKVKINDNIEGAFDNIKKELLKRIRYHSV